MRIGLGNGIVHKLQAGVSADKAFACLAAQKIGKQLLRSTQAGELPVIAHVGLIQQAVCRVVQHGQHVGNQVELLLARFAPGHIQPKVHIPQRFISGAKTLRLLLPLLGRHGLICVHNAVPPLFFFRLFYPICR